MPRARRCYHELLCRLLTVCLEPTIKTHVLYEVHLSGKLTYELLNDAERFGLVNRTGDEYQTTRKGQELLDTWHRFLSFLGEE